MKAALQFILLGMIAWGCSIKPQPIDYGHEVCTFCNMNIVDQRFGCEIVTNKGKVYKFDAIECLVNYTSENAQIKENAALLLTNSLDKPGHLFNMEECYYFHCVDMPSPMGMFINPIVDVEYLEKVKSENEGKVYAFSELSAFIDSHYHGVSQNK